MQFHTTPRQNGVKMVYEKLDCRRENDTLLLPQKSSESSDETHSHRHDRPTDMPMVVSFSAAFRGEYEKNIASTSLGFPAYLATPPCDNGILCANKGWNPPFAGLHLNS